MEEQEQMPQIREGPHVFKEQNGGLYGWYKIEIKLYNTFVKYPKYLFTRPQQQHFI